MRHEGKTMRFGAFPGCSGDRVNELNELKWQFRSLEYETSTVWEAMKLDIRYPWGNASRVVMSHAILGWKTSPQIPLASIQAVQPWPPLKLLSRSYDPLGIFDHIWTFSKTCTTFNFNQIGFCHFLQPKSWSGFKLPLQETDLARLTRAVREWGSPAKGSNVWSHLVTQQKKTRHSKFTWVYPDSFL